jgi:glycosyltransferase involved in cell wall biosynthesis
MSEVLWVGKGIPNLIKSAGDIRSLRMLKILKRKHNVRVIARSADFGESDVKAIGCESHLTGNLQNTIQVSLGAKPADIIILSHWTIANELLDFIRGISTAKIYIDTIDVEFLRLSRKLKFDPSQIEEREVNRVKILELNVYQNADGIITASNQDKEELLKYDNFKIIDLPCLFAINNEYRVSNGKNAYIVCNWTHDPNIVSTSYLCEKVVPNANILFYIVGKHPPELIRNFASSKIIVSGAEYEIGRFLSHMNMLLSPVFYGAGMNGKIGEALAFGIPVITSSLGAEPWGLKHRETAMVANTTEAFLDSINEIINDEDLRKQLSANGRELMKGYTIEYWQDKFLDAIGV